MMRRLRNWWHLQRRLWRGEILDPDIYEVRRRAREIENRLAALGVVADTQGRDGGD